MDGGKVDEIQADTISPEAPAAEHVQPSSPPRSSPPFAPDASSDETDEANDAENDPDAYEQIRLRNIEANNRILAELGLLGRPANALLERDTAKPAPPKRAAAPKRTAAALQDDALLLPRYVVVWQRTSEGTRLADEAARRGRHKSICG